MQTALSKSQYIQGKQCAKALWYRHHRKDLLPDVNDSIPTLSAIAIREKIDAATLSRMMNLAFLAPDIVEAIGAGRQPADLTLQKILKTTLPVEWEQQKRILGFC